MYALHGCRLLFPSSSEDYKKDMRGRHLKWIIMVLQGWLLNSWAWAHLVLPQRFTVIICLWHYKESCIIIGFEMDVRHGRSNNRVCTSKSPLDNQRRICRANLFTVSDRSFMKSRISTRNRRNKVPVIRQDILNPQRLTSQGDVVYCHQSLHMLMLPIWTLESGMCTIHHNSRWTARNTNRASVPLK